MSDQLEKITGLKDKANLLGGVKIIVRLFSLLYIAASHTVLVDNFSCVLLVVIYVLLLFLTRYLSYFSQLTLKMSENVAKRSEFESENSDILA